MVLQSNGCLVNLQKMLSWHFWPVSVHESASFQTVIVFPMDYHAQNNVGLTHVKNMKEDEEILLDSSDDEDDTKH